MGMRPKGRLPSHLRRCSHLWQDCCTFVCRQPKVDSDICSDESAPFLPLSLAEDQDSGSAASGILEHCYVEEAVIIELDMHLLGVTPFRQNVEVTLLHEAADNVKCKTATT